MRGKIFGKMIILFFIVMLCIQMISVDALAVEEDTSTKLETPTNLQWNTRGSVKWKRVVGEHGYRLCLYKDNILLNCTGYGGMSHFDYLDSIDNFYIYLAYRMYESGSYTFTVQAYGYLNNMEASSDVSVMSEPFIYNHPGKSLERPRNLSLTGNILKWDSDNLNYPPGTGFYEVSIYDQKYDLDIGGQSISLNENSLDLEGLISGNPNIKDGMYQVSVSAKSNNIHEIGHSIESEKLSFPVEGGLVILEPNISINENNLTLEKGKTTTLIAITEPVNTTVKWSSSDESVVTVDNNGNINAVGYGTTTINASITISGRSKLVSCDITVPGIIFAKEKAYYPLNPNHSYNTNYDVYPTGASVLWKSDNEKIVTVDNKGMIRTVDVGKANITGVIKLSENTQISSTYQVEVYEAYLEYSSIIMNIGEETMFPPLCISYLPDGYEVNYKATDQSIVTIGTNRRIKANKIGTTLVNAEIIVDGAKIATYPCNVTVNGISLNKHKLDLYKGSTETLVATFRPSSSSIKWTSSNSNIAVINGVGNTCEIRAVSSGNAIITAEIMVNGKKMIDTCSLSITEYSPEDIAKAYADYASTFDGDNWASVQRKLPGLHRGAWCSSFVGETASVFGLSKIIPSYPSVSNVYKNILTGYSAKGFHFTSYDPQGCFKVNSTYMNRGDYIPKIGDLIFFKWNENAVSTFSHIGIVSGVKNPTNITVVHGNNQWEKVGIWSSLNFRTYKGRGPNQEIVGFVRPDYNYKVTEWSGQIKHYFKCPIDVRILFNDEELNSATNVKTASFGTMEIEEDCITVTLDYGNPYNIIVTGNGEGTMDLITEFDTNHGQNIRSFMDVPITNNTTAYVYTNMATGGIELLVNPDDKATGNLWYAMPGDIVDKADKTLTKAYLNQVWYEESNDSNTNPNNDTNIVIEPKVKIKYKVIEDSTKNGVISISLKDASKGERLMITIIPDKGYKLDNLTIVDKDGNSIMYTQNSDNTYRFTMPSSSVRVNATFIEIDWINPFNDVDESDWYYESVKYVYENELFSGTSPTTFSPNMTMTRGMMVTVLYRMAGSPISFSKQFTDIQDNMWYTNAVNWAGEQNLVKGIGNGLFAPIDDITREQMAVILYNYIKTMNIKLPETRKAKIFSDNDFISDWAKPSIDSMYQAGVLNGSGNNKFNPKGKASRSELATMLMNLLNNK